MGFILFWNVDDYSECGGGDFYEDFETIEKVYEKIEELSTEEKITFQRVVIKSGERKIIPVEKVTKWKVG